MRTEAAKVIVTCAGHNFVTLKIETDQGAHGIDDAMLNGRELVGEIFNPIWDAKHLIPNQVIDHICRTIVGASDPSPVTMGYALHFDTRVPNFGIQKFMRHSEEAHAVVPHENRFADGHLPCCEAPGHSVDIDETLEARYPYKPAYLPVARLEDGTMWN